MNTIWYRISVKFPEASITPVSVSSETEDTIVVEPSPDILSKGGRVRKMSAHAYYPTWEEACRALIVIADKRLTEARDQVEVESQFLLDIAALMGNQE